MRQSARRLRCRPNSLGGISLVVDRLISVPGGVFNGPAHCTRFRSQTDTFCNGFRCMLKTILEIRADGNVHSKGDGGDMRGYCITLHIAIPLPDRECIPCARCRQSLKTKIHQKPGCAHIPGIRDDESTASVMKFP